MSLMHQDSGLGHVAYHSAFANCIMPLLRALNWPGSSRHLAEALPHPAAAMTLADLRKVMKNIHYQQFELKTSLSTLDSRLLPCLFVTEQGKPYVLLSFDSRGYQAIDGQTGGKHVLPEADLLGRAYIFRAKEVRAGEPVKARNWIFDVIVQHRRVIQQAVILSLFLNLFAIATPLFIMVIYDKVIISGSINMLSQLAIGLVIVLFGSLALQIIRSCLLSHVGARLDKEVSNAIFERILYLPSSYTESAAIGSQSARLKEFDSVRDFFSGPLSSLVIEFPFVLIYLAVIYAIGGQIASVPIAMLLLLTLILLGLRRLVRANRVRSSKANAKRAIFLLESIKHMRVIKYCGAESIWRARFRKIAADMAVVNLTATVISAVTNTIADMFMILTGATILLVGTYQTMSGALTIGGMVAIMMLSWRVIGPVKSLLAALPSIEQVINSMKQINALMSIKPECDPDKLHHALGALKGEISCRRVSFRYKSDPNPILAGVSFTIAPGAVAVFMGHDGSGKSSLFKLLLDLYQPLAGTIAIDNRDVRQLDHIELRHAIAYVPQKCDLFTGTIRDNLLFACPDADDARMVEATKLIGVFDAIESLPEGFMTWIDGHQTALLPASFRKQLILARAFIKNAKILLMDEPTHGLNLDAECALLSAIESCRRQKTILIISHDKQMMRLCDQLLFLERGQILLNGPPREVMHRLPADLL